MIAKNETKILIIISNFGGCHWVSQKQINKNTK